MGHDVAIPRHQDVRYLSYPRRIEQSDNPGVKRGPRLRYGLVPIVVIVVVLTGPEPATAPARFGLATVDVLAGIADDALDVSGDGRAVERAVSSTATMVTALFTRPGLEVAITVEGD